MKKTYWLLLITLIGFVSQAKGQIFDTDQFERDPSKWHGNVQSQKYFPYRKGELWGICDSSKSILIEPCTKSFPTFLEDPFFNYLIEFEDVNSASQEQFVRIYDKHFKLKQSVHVTNTGIMQKLNNGNYLYDLHYLFDSLLNIIYKTDNYLIYTTNKDYSASLPGLISEPIKIKGGYNLKIYSENFKELYTGITQSYWIDVYRNNFWVGLNINNDTNYLLNLNTNNKIFFYKKNLNDYVAEHDFVYQREINQEKLTYRLYNNDFNLIADSVDKFTFVKKNRFFIQKKSKCYLVDTLGNIKREFKYKYVNYSNNYFFCYDSDGLKNIVDLEEKDLFNGKYVLTCNSSSFQSYISLKNKFVTIKNKLAIINAKDSVINYFEDYDNIYAPFHSELDTLLKIDKTTIKKEKSGNGEIVNYKDYTHKLISVSNIDYTPKNCNNFNFYYNDSLKFYFLITYKEGKSGIISLSGNEMAPMIYTGIRLTRNKRFFILSKGKSQYLYSIKLNKLCDSSFIFINDGLYDAPFFASKNGKYYEYFVDSNLTIHPLDSIQIKIASIFQMSASVSLGIGVNTKTGEKFLVNTKSGIVSTIKNNVDLIQNIRGIDEYQPLIYRVQLQSDPDYNIYLNSDLKKIGELVQDTMYKFINGSDFFIDRNNNNNSIADAVYQFNYKNSKINSLIKMQISSAKQFYLFQNENYDSYDFHPYFKYFTFFKDSTITIIDKLGKVILANFKGRVVSVTDSLLVVRNLKGDSTEFYHNNKLILKLRGNNYSIFNDHIVFTNQMSNDSIYRYGIVDYTGKLIVPDKYCYLHSHNVSWSIDSVLYIAQDATSKKYGLINLKNETVLSFDYDTILPEIGHSQIMGFVKNKEVFEFNPYSYKVCKLDTISKNYNLVYRVDVDENGLYGLKDYYGNLVVKHKYSNPIHQEIYTTNLISTSLYFTTKEIKTVKGETINVKCYFDIKGTEYWDD